MMKNSVNAEIVSRWRMTVAICVISLPKAISPRRSARMIVLSIIFPEPILVATRGGGAACNAFRFARSTAATFDVF
jgi:hypothetical protein